MSTEISDADHLSWIIPELAAGRLAQVYQARPEYLRVCG
jgi:hypothetical protein